MSTRCTIWYSDKLHLFRECFDDSVWLEAHHEFGTTLIPLPQEMLKAALASESVKHFAEHGPDTDWTP